jgi:hypothetical protein
MSIEDTPVVSTLTGKPVASEMVGAADAVAAMPRVSPEATRANTATYLPSARGIPTRGNENDILKNLRVDVEFLDAVLSPWKVTRSYLK